VGKAPPHPSTSKKASRASTAASMAPPCTRPVIHSTPASQPPQLDPPCPPSLAAKLVDVLLLTMFWFLRQNTVMLATVANASGPGQCSERAVHSEPTVKVEEVHSQLIDPFHCLI
jgi:hypothetical protein